METSLTYINLYEHLELDLDGYYYSVMNSDVDYPYKNPKLYDFVKWFNDNDVNDGLYYKHTALYFTFEGIKYHVSWTFYHEDVLQDAYNKLMQLGAKYIAINYGELD